LDALYSCLNKNFILFIFENELVIQFGKSSANLGLHLAVLKFLNVWNLRFAAYVGCERKQIVAALRAINGLYALQRRPFSILDLIVQLLVR
jgi:hypothetical protein